MTHPSNPVPLRAALMLPLALGCGLFAASLPGCMFVSWHGFQAKTTLERSLDAPAEIGLDVETRNGAVTVEVDPSLSQIQVRCDFVCRGATQEEADERIQGVEVRVEEVSDKTLRIEPVFPEPSQGGDGASVHVVLPSSKALRIKTSNGSIAVGTSEGAPEGTAVEGEVRAATSNGKIQIASVHGPVFASSSNGGVRVEGTSQDVEIRSTNGTLHVSNVGGAISAKTSNGKINVTLSHDQQGPVVAATTNGRIELNLGDGFRGQLEMSTSNQRVEVTDPQERVTHRELRRNGGEITIGEGGERSRLTTSNGKIHVTVE